MRYYLAKLCYEIICGDGNHTPQFEEQIRLLNTVSYANALQQAQAIGEAETLILQPANRARVEWKFLGVTELLELQPMVHGAELFQTHHEIAYADGYRAFVKHKSNQLQANPGYAIDSISC